MIGAFLRGKFHWERGEGHDALACLREILGAESLYLPAEVVGQRAGGTWEGLIAGVVSDDDYRIVPFADAVTSLWRAFPGQYLLTTLEVRAVCGDPLTADDVAWLDEAAAQGILSTDPVDHDRIGRIVLFEADHPQLAAAVDGARLTEAIRRADSEGAALTFAGSHPELVADLFFHAVFHAARVMDRGMVTYRLERALRLQPELVDQVAATVAAGDAAAIIRYGMRRESPSCLESLLEAIRTRDPEALAPECAPPG